MKKNTLLASVSALALIVAGCNADSGDNLGLNNTTEETVPVDDNVVVANEGDTVIVNDNDNAL